MPMKKLIAISCACMLLATTAPTFAITYDPVTNTYIQDTPTESTSATTTQTTTTTTTTSSSNSTANTIGVYDPVTNTYVVQESVSADTSVETAEEESTAISSIAIDVTADVELQEWN
jgi:hypothetical protein